MSITVTLLQARGTSDVSREVVDRDSASQDGFAIYIALRQLGKVRAANEEDTELNYKGG